MKTLDSKTITGPDVNVRLEVVDTEIKSEPLTTLYIHFDGTKGVAQWVRDFLFWPFLFRKPYRDMKDDYLVCWGFFQGYKAVQDEIYRFINKNLAAINFVQITGYSRGGACAIFCAEDIAYKYVIPYYCETWGAPRVLSREGLKVYELRGVSKRIQNWIFGSDLVCSLPPVYRNPGPLVRDGGFPRRRWDIVGRIKDHSGYSILRG